VGGGPAPEGASSARGTVLKRSRPHSPVATTTISRATHCVGNVGNREAHVPTWEGVDRDESLRHPVLGYPVQLLQRLAVVTCPDYQDPNEPLPSGVGRQPDPQIPQGWQSLVGWQDESRLQRGYPEGRWARPPRASRAESFSCSQGGSSRRRWPAGALRILGAESGAEESMAARATPRRPLDSGVHCEAGKPARLERAHPQLGVACGHKPQRITLPL